MTPEGIARAAGEQEAGNRAPYILVYLLGFIQARPLVSGLFMPQYRKNHSPETKWEWFFGYFFMELGQSG